MYVKVTIDELQNHIDNENICDLLDFINQNIILIMIYY